MSIAYGILNYPIPYMRAFQMWAGLFPAFIHATWIALRSRKKKPSYQVNVKPIGKIEKKNPWLAILPQGGIILLSIFSVIYTFFKEVIAWDFYLLNFVWSMWSIWTLSGICLAAVGKHRWPEEGVSEKRMVPSFFPKIKELFITVILTVSIMVFFTMADMSRVNEYLGGFRLKVLSALSFEKPVSMVTKEIFKGPEVSKPYLKEKTEQPEKSAAEVIPKEKKEEGLKKEEVVKEEGVIKEVIKKEETIKKEEVIKKENWVVHVVSVKTIEQAMIYKERLMAVGFPAYSIRAKVKGEDWIRVRVGFFKSRDEAQKAAPEINEKFILKGPYWITKVSKKEMEDLLGK
jgi:hypothetical protein